MPTLTPTQMHALGDLWTDNTSREFDAILALAGALGFERAKTILSAFTTNAAPSPLADYREVSDDDRVLASYPIHVLADAIRQRACAVVVFSPEDVFDRFNGPSADAIHWLGLNSNRLEDRMSEHGNQTLDDLLIYDGVYRDEDYEGEEEPPTTARAGKRYAVDGHLYDDPESDWDGLGAFGPFWIFDIEAQDYVGEQYPTRAEAEAEMERRFPGQGYFPSQEDIDRQTALLNRCE